MVVSTKVDVWQELLQTCILGSGRRQADIQAQGILGEFLADMQKNAAHAVEEQSASSGEEDRILMALSATSIAMRAGKAPLNAAALPAPPAPCAAERHQYCGPYSLTLLNHAMADQSPGGDRVRLNLIRDWLAFCLAQNKIIAPEYLPRLLDFAADKEPLHQLLAQSGGNHFFWLLDLNHRWKEAYKTIVPGAISDDSLIDKIELGIDSERSVALKALRKTNPDKARDCLVALWSKEQAEQRLSLLKAMETGLTLADEPFLQDIALADRRKEVRRQAANMLAALPGSRLLTRMQERASGFVKVVGGRTLQITLPAALDDSMLRDEIQDNITVDSRIGQKAGWLYQIVSLVDPAFWYGHTGLSAGAFIQLLQSNEEWSLPMVLGLLNASALHHNSEFQDAIISFEEIHLTESLPGKAFLQALPAEKLERLVLAKLPRWAQTDRRSAPRLDLWYYLELVDFQWSESFSVALVQFIIKEIKEKVPVFGHTFFSNAANFGLRMHVAAGKYLNGLNLAGEEIDTWARNGLERFIDTLRLRYEMNQSFVDSDEDATTESTPYLKEDSEINSA
jgi:hypothetical protein